MLLVILAAAGCTTQPTEQPAQGSSNPAPPSSQAPAGKAPPINSPELNLAGYQDRVCDLLTSTQVALFGIRRPGRAGDEGSGPVCRWNTVDDTPVADFNVTILTKAKNGWEGVYERWEGESFFQQAGEINDYPAVHLTGPKGVCSTQVGVRRDLVFEAQVFVNGTKTPGFDTPCSVSDEVASSVIDTLKTTR